MARPMCSECKKQPCAINYYRNGVAHYRAKCNRCNGKKGRQKRFVPNWKKAGYKKKPTCDRCGFKSKYSEQMVVFHRDGNLTNTSFTNLRTVCLNCVVDVDKHELPWKLGDLVTDF